jgi:hypothetical protein
MSEKSVTMTTRFAPGIEDVAETLKKQLSGAQNSGELTSELYRTVGGCKLALMTFLKPSLLTRSHSVLTVLLAEGDGHTDAELICVNTNAYLAGDAGDQRYRKEAEEVLRELGFTGGETEEEKGLFSGLKDWLRKEGL